MPSSKRQFDPGRRLSRLGLCEAGGLRTSARSTSIRRLPSFSACRFARKWALCGPSPISRSLGHVRQTDTARISISGRRRRPWDSGSGNTSAPWPFAQGMPWRCRPEQAAGGRRTCPGPSPAPPCRDLGLSDAVETAVYVRRPLGPCQAAQVHPRKRGSWTSQSWHLGWYVPVSHLPNRPFY